MDYRSLHAKTVADLRQIGRSLKVKFPVGTTKARMIEMILQHIMEEDGASRTGAAERPAGTECIAQESARRTGRFCRSRGGGGERSAARGEGTLGRRPAFAAGRAANPNGRRGSRRRLRRRPNGRQKGRKRWPRLPQKNTKSRKHRLWQKTSAMNSAMTSALRRHATRKQAVMNRQPIAMRVQQPRLSQGNARQGSAGQRFERNAQRYDNNQRFGPQCTAL